MRTTETPSTELAERIERVVGQKIRAFQTVQGGYSPVHRWRCITETGSVFVKVASVPITAEFLQREYLVYTKILGRDFVPELRGWEAHESTPILALEDLSAYHWAPPWEPRHVEQVVEQIHMMHANTADLGTFLEVHGEEKTNGWATVAQNPTPFLALGWADTEWLDASLPHLIAAEANCPTDGTQLCHWDLRSDNMCLSDSRTLFIDWNHACLANPRLDLGFWLPSLAYESGVLPEQILPDAPEVAAWVSGFFAARAGLPIIPHAPRVRKVQKEQLATALPWAIRALDLPPLPKQSLLRQER